MNLSAQKYLLISTFLLSFCSTSNQVNKLRDRIINISIESSSEEFIEITLKTLKDEFEANPKKRLIRNILSWIYSNLSDKGEEKLALFVAYSLHNTDFYTTFQRGNLNDNFRSRGLMGISGKDNYRKFTLACNSRVNYLKAPRLLSDINQKTVEDTVNYLIKYRLSNFNFEAVMNSLEQDSQNTNEEKKIFKDVYFKLLESYSKN